MLIVAVFLYRVIRRLISIHSCQATLEASNEALVKQGRANAENVDLVGKVQKVGRLISVSVFVGNYSLHCTGILNNEREKQGEERNVK